MLNWEMASVEALLFDLGRDDLFGGWVGRGVCWWDVDKLRLGWSELLPGENRLDGVGFAGGGVWDDCSGTDYGRCDGGESEDGDGLEVEVHVDDLKCSLKCFFGRSGPFRLELAIR